MVGMFFVFLASLFNLIGLEVADLCVKEALSSEVQIESNEDFHFALDDPVSSEFDEYLEMSENPVELPKLCLHMIVKNEAHVIKRCLDSVMPLIDYWVIVDTGSTDATKEIVQEYLQNIPGELYELPWKTWGETRSEAIARALNKAEYILLMDADDVLKFQETVKLPRLTKDQYNMWRGSHSFTYQRPQIVKGDLPWRYIGVTHEYLDCPYPYTSETLETVRYITLDDGAESRDLKQKFLKNVLLLEDGLKKEPNNDRYAFYLADSYLNSGEKGKALEMYQKRITMGGWDQEIFWSKLQMSHIMRDLKFPTHVVLESYKDAHDYRPHRAEPVYYIAEILNQLERHTEAYQILKNYSHSPKPAEKDALFNVDWIEDYGLLFQLSISAHYAKHFEESLDACDLLLTNENIPESWRTLVETNRSFPIQKLKEKIAAR